MHVASRDKVAFAREHRRRGDYDEWRTEQLGRLGITALRFPDDIARRQLLQVTVAVRQACVERA